jgi:type IV secretion system protein VirB6
MSMICPAPDVALGVAVRLSTYASCEARALGENGFQALAGGPLGSSLLSGLVTIFIALIGYRFLLGPTPDLREGVGWTVRFGLVLALVTSWPAFQTLFYRVAVDGPGEVAAIVLPASGLPATDLNERIQAAYDTMRLGTIEARLPPADNPAQKVADQDRSVQQFNFESPLPNTASMLVISTSGVFAALEIAIGFLLAVGPLAVMALLFRGTSSLFSGWLRALAGSAFALLAATVVAAIDLMMVESELGHLETFRLLGTDALIDPQALTTIVMLFALVMTIALFAATRIASALRLPDWHKSLAEIHVPHTQLVAQIAGSGRASPAGDQSQEAGLIVQSRVAAVREVLTRASVRDSEAFQAQQQLPSPARHSKIAEAADQSARSRSGAKSGLGSRRNAGRRTRSAAGRDRRA